jgi:hypothetical protein
VDRSKYQRWHDQIIERARGRILKSYKEAHYILPRSMGGSDQPYNIVDLTYREHYLIHWLLVKLTVGLDNFKMRCALWRMSQVSETHTGRRVASWRFEKAKKHFVNGFVAKIRRDKNIKYGGSGETLLAKSEAVAASLRGKNPNVFDRELLSDLASDFMKMTKYQVKRRKRSLA